jgi:peptidoglycan L-alanyl-D-glutamate endopeptidase CwlK
MRDQISVERAAKLHPKVRAEVIACIQAAEAKLAPNCAIRIVQGLRTIAEQDALYAQGRTKPGKIVTNARGGSSYHNYGLAIDFAILIDKDGNGTYDELSWDIRKDNDRDGVADWLEVVKVFEAAGWEWGGRWASIKDNPHVQKTFGLTWRQLMDKHTKKQFIQGTQYVII